MPGSNDEYVIRPAGVHDARLVALERASMFRDMGSVSADESELLRRASEPWLSGQLTKGDYIGWLVEHRRIVVAGGGIFSRDSNPNTFYLPLAGSSCRIKLTFSDSKQILAIEPGPAFDTAQWEQVVEEIERTGPYKVGRDCSFSNFRVDGSWRGRSSGVQILPPPVDAPRAPCEMAEHPFVLEFPVKVSDITAV